MNLYCDSLEFLVAFLTQDTPKIDVENLDIHKALVDAAEDSDNSQIPTEPPSPSRPDASEVRGKKKSRGRPPLSARRSGRAKARTHAVSVVKLLQLFNVGPEKLKDHQQH